MTTAGCAFISVCNQPEADIHCESMRLSARSSASSHDPEGHETSEEGVMIQRNAAISLTHGCPQPVPSDGVMKRAS